MKFKRNLKDIREYIGRNPSHTRRLEHQLSTITLTEEAEAIERFCYSGLSYINMTHRTGFHSCIKMASYAYHFGCRNILEIGAGVSSALWSRFGEATGASICIVDADFEIMNSYLDEESLDSLKSSNFELIRGTTITADELVDFYSANGIQAVGGVNVADFAAILDYFKNANCSKSRWQQVTALAPGRKWSIPDLVIDGESLRFQRDMIDIFSQGNRFDIEVAKLRSAETRGEGCIMSKLLDHDKPWDMVFFDSGELASLIEWGKLKDRIAIGGIAAFHDIFFPKSFKNFIVCASIVADPSWKVVFVDESTMQGLMIAQRQA